MTPTSDFLSLTREQCAAIAFRVPGSHLLEEVRRVCKAAEATFWVVSPDGRLLLGALNVGRTPEAVLAAAVPVDSSLIGLVAAMQMATSNGADASFNRSVDERTGTSTQAMVAAPVHVAGRGCGVLSAINPESDADHFSAGDLDALKLKARELGELAASIAG